MCVFVLTVPVLLMLNLKKGLILYNNQNGKYSAVNAALRLASVMPYFYLCAVLAVVCFSQKQKAASELGQNMKKAKRALGSKQ